MPLLLYRVAVSVASVAMCAALAGPAKAAPWPGSQSVTTAVFQGGALVVETSGLDYEGTGTTSPGVLWVVNSELSKLYRLMWNGTAWVRDPTDDWSFGKPLRFPGGGGFPDSEGVTLDAGSLGPVFVVSERNIAAPTVSRISVLRYDVSGGQTITLTATHE